MKWNRGPSGFAAICALFLLALACSGAQARANGRHAVYQASDLQTRPIASVAILPFVSIDDDAGVERDAERTWMALYGEAGTRWMTSSEVGVRLATRPRDGHALLDAAQSQIWRSGEIAPETAARLARLLGVDAVLGVRIDEWEIVDGGCGVVAMTATLNGADGSRLWAISGLASHGKGRRSFEASFDWNLAHFWNPMLEPRDEDRKVGVALRKLLCEWTPLMPDAMFERGQLPQGLAGLQAELPN